MFVLLGIVFLIESYFLWNVEYITIISLLLSLFIPSIYSYLLHRKIKSKK